MPTAAVCFDVETARVLLQQGRSVVVLGEDGEALGRAAPGLRQHGRVAIFVGDPADGAAREAARVMAAEQFGDEPVIVPSVEFARRLDLPVK